MVVKLVLLMGWIIKSTVEMGSGGMIHIQSFMKTGKYVEEIWRFCLNNLKAFKVGITNDRDL
jgi:hypothetical protein